ncbi:MULTISPECIES: alpha/beta hydrolase [Nostocales]|uniref:Alpha/beta hydrolase n=3 Tax=Nostocales TaxID=1161 RepID=A0A0C1NKX4_9CYAN|nr:dienelactone hydrolase family protein [Tolypothrix bouteillei]KAF3887612.1 alpha/beta hydrolase [Tolypothrix bouteillei VB521301]
MQPIYDESFEMIVENAEEKPQEEEYYPVKLITSRGSIHCRYYLAENAKTAVILVGGVGGDWDTPARGLYPLLGEILRKEGIASLRVQYRNPTDLVESTLDVLAGLTYLQDKGVEEFALIGHSFGGAVVIQAAAQSADVRTVVTIATQAYGAEPASELATRCSLLLLHGTSDPVLPASCSQYVYQIAREPKRVILYPNGGHGLDEVADEVYLVVRDWIVQQLNRATANLY